MLIIRFVHSLARFLQYRKLLCNSDFAAGTWFEYHQGHFFGIGIDDEYSAFLPRGI